MTTTHDSSTFNESLNNSPGAVIQLPHYSTPEVEHAVATHATPWLIASYLRTCDPGAISALAYQYRHHGISNAESYRALSQSKEIFSQSYRTNYPENTISSTATPIHVPAQYPHQLSYNPNLPQSQHCQQPTGISSASAHVIDNIATHLAELSQVAQDTYTTIFEHINDVETKLAHLDRNNGTYEQASEVINTAQATIHSQHARYQHQLTITGQKIHELTAPLNPTQHNTGFDQSNCDSAISYPYSFPPQNTRDPRLIAAAWLHLNTDQRHDLIINHPELLGHLDGVPVAIRDQANKAVLEKLLQDPTISEQVKHHLCTIAAILNDPQLPPHLLMDLSPDGTKAAVVTGSDPDTADHIATFVPGTGEDLSDAKFVITEQSDQMWRSAQQQKPTGKSAVISWLDYRPPYGLWDWHNPTGNGNDATNEKFALAAREDLDKFQQGLRATHHGPSDLTVIGHSYGTVVVGYAAGTTDNHYHLNADRIILLASPGTGARTPEDFHLIGNNGHDITRSDVHDHIWECQDKYDPIKYIEGLSPAYHTDPRILGDTTEIVPFNRNVTIVHHHGPNSIHHFNDTPQRPPGAPWTDYSVHIHEESYWKNGNEALTNMGKLITNSTGVTQH